MSQPSSTRSLCRYSLASGVSPTPIRGGILALAEILTTSRPPRGRIRVRGVWRERRFGFLKQRNLTCIHGHDISVGARPFEIALPCGWRPAPSQLACDAYLYIVTTRARQLWAMDVTKDESTLIDRECMDMDQIVDFFGVGFPSVSRLLQDS